MSVFSSLHHHIDKPEKVFSSRQDQQCQYFTTKNGVVSPNFLVPKAFAQFQENRPKLCKKMCLSPNFPHQQIRGNYGIFPVLGGEVKMKQECCFYRLPSNLKKNNDLRKRKGKVLTPLLDLCIVLVLIKIILQSLQKVYTTFNAELLFFVVYSCVIEGKNESKL